MAVHNPNSDQIFSGLIDTLYEAAFDDAAFIQFFAEFGQSTRCHFAGVEVVEPGAVNVCQWVEQGTYGLSAASIRQLNSTYAVHNPFVDLVADSVKEGDIFFTSDVMTRKEYRNLVYYDEFLRHYEFEHISGLYVVHNAEKSIVVSTSRDSTAGAFEADDRELMQRLIPHLNRFFRLRGYLDKADIEKASGWGALNYVAHGAAIVDVRGRVLFLNDKAISIVRVDNGVSLENNALKLNNRRAHGKFTKCLARATRCYQNMDEYEGVFQTVAPKVSGQRPYHLQIVPLRHSVRPMMAAIPAAVVFIFDLDDRGSVTESTLSGLFGLTRTEAKVAMLIAQGYSLEAIAENLDHAVSTTRTTLKRVYIKTGTHRQNELATLILAGVGLIRQPCD